ncbi:hypothetical protein U1Q18_025558 [Sarracenia purpurea var. burkii]
MSLIPRSSLIPIGIDSAVGLSQAPDCGGCRLASQTGLDRSMCSLYLVALLDGVPCSAEPTDLTVGLNTGLDRDVKRRDESRIGSGGA